MTRLQKIKKAKIIYIEVVGKDSVCIVTITKKEARYLGCEFDKNQDQYDFYLDENNYLYIRNAYIAQVENFLQSKKA